MSKPFHYVNLILIILASIFLIPLEMKIIGWSLLGVTLLSLFFCEKHYRRDMLLVIIVLGLLGITPINTDIGPAHFIEMSLLLIMALIIPYVITRNLYQEKTIVFPFHHGRKWYTLEILYIFITAAVAYFALPFYLSNTGAYHNWTVKPGTTNLVTLFIGTNSLGIWDELFFITSILTIFKKHFSFTLANAAQAVIFTAFLFELGFRGWAPLVLYPFALSQGYIFNKTHSLLYILTIHLTIDFFLYLALIHAYFPQWLPIFLT